MGLRPARCYKKTERPFTRQSRRKPKKGYVKGVPSPKIKKFEVGDPKKSFDTTLYLVSNETAQIRHNALESVRVTLHKRLEKDVGKEAYFAKILIYPHHVLRENLLATGAGADRFQTGMRKAYGKNVSSAAQVKAGQKLVEVRVAKAKEGKARTILKAVSSKFSAKCVIAA